MALQSLEDKVKKSQDVLKEALERFSGHIALAWTGGKDSTTTLHLLKDLCGGEIPIPVLNIDTSVKFKEIYEFRDRVAAEWGLNLIIERNEEALKEIIIAADKAECCFRLKAEVIARAITKYGWQALITGMRWDEHPDRAADEYFVPLETPPHFRVQPILHFNELDIWSYIRSRNVPFCSLYQRGYRSLGCEPCTKTGIPGRAERAGRNQDKEEIMKRLRAMGYF
jgi:phosphoadenosine phosphosulfate reductase|uniref:Phosphoadenosine phosphosulfate reductase family protein n=1 Tax=Desulfobacca acetoxidans TaxID=60893 RepID=A0A7V6DQQ3_9BACT